MDKRDLEKNELYEAVKSLVEIEDHHPHIHLNQHKLYTLSSIAFQYLLYRSTKKPGAYIIRAEDSLLAEKLSKRSKDLSTRKFLQTLLIPRRMKYGKSTFYLDFFNINTWAMTNEVPKNMIQGALIIKNTSDKPMSNLAPLPDEEESSLPFGDLPKDYYLSVLTDFVPKTITIAFERDYENLHPISFDFIKKEGRRSVAGVTLSKELSWDNLDE